MALPRAGGTHEAVIFVAPLEGMRGLLDERGAAEERETRAKLRAALAKFLTARGLLPEGASRPAAVLEAVLRFLAASDAGW